MFSLFQEKIVTPSLARYSDRPYSRTGRNRRPLTVGSAAVLVLATVALFSIWFSRPAGARDGLMEPMGPPNEGQPPKLTLSQAVMCESLNGYEPINPAVVFSVRRQRVYCFTHFDPVPQRTVIYHKWYRRDVLMSTVKLQLNPPHWTTFSNMQLRESDKGPWQVKVTDEDGHVFHTLRYSITD